MTLKSYHPALKGHLRRVLLGYEHTAVLNTPRPKFFFFLVPVVLSVSFCSSIANLLHIQCSLSLAHALAVYVKCEVSVIGLMY